MPEKNTPDIRVEPHGSVVLFRTLNEVADDWLRNNVQDDAQWFGGALVVEPRYVMALAEGAAEAGLRVVIGCGAGF